MIGKQVWGKKGLQSIFVEKQIIQFKLFLKEKHTADSKFEKLKARILAGGHTQNKYN